MARASATVLLAPDIRAEPVAMAVKPHASKRTPDRLIAFRAWDAAIFSHRPHLGDAECGQSA